MAIFCKETSKRESNQNEKKEIGKMLSRKISPKATSNDHFFYFLTKNNGYGTITSLFYFLVFEIFFKVLPIHNFV